MTKGSWLGDLNLPTPAIVAVLQGGLVAEATMAEGMGADMLEARLDLLPGDPLESLRMLRGATALPIIATCRISSEGGAFRGAEKDRIEVLRRSSAFADLIDFEVGAGIGKLVSSISTPVLASYHNFDGMPGEAELLSIVDEMIRSGAAAGKLAVTPSTLEESLMLLRILLKSKIPLSVLGMGGVGRHLRIMAPVYGSILTYGYISMPTAPSQMSVKELREAFDMLDLRS
ncbi:MAG: type I 3-dehydroquinate dehydratase [Methanotrichaceae archaeon]|nr:type I 3-dehydroquinate dehydratase [Methanotrichaceae archaeon]